MKKLSIVLICLFALFAFVGCDDSDSTPGPTGPVSDKTEYSVAITPSTDGTVAAQTIDSSKATTGSAATKVEVVIPAGTRVLKADGTPITTPLTVTVVASDPKSEATFAGQSFKITDQNSAAGTFASAGHFSVDVTAGGQAVDTITNPLEIKLTPEPGHSYKEGDLVDIVAWASPLFRFNFKARFTGGYFVILIVRGNAFGGSLVNNIPRIIVPTFRFNIAFGRFTPTAT